MCEIKKGQWVRLENKLIEIKSLDTYEETYLSEKTFVINDSLETYYEFSGQTLPKACSRPQELIQKGDAIRFKDGLFLVMFVDENGVYIYDNNFVYTKIDNDEIKGILTPNSKGNFIRQWEE